MKKAIILLMCALLLVGCGNETKENKEIPEETESVELTEEPVEETEEPEEDEWTKIYEKEYGTDGEKVSMSLSIDDDGKYHFPIYCFIDEEWKAAFAFLMYAVDCQTINLQSEEIDAHVICKCGEDIISTLGISIKQEDGESVSVNAQDWCDENFSKKPEEEDGRDFYAKINEYYEDFLSGNDLLKEFSTDDSENAEDTIVYQDGNVIIHYTGMSEDGDDYDVNFTIENLSSKTLTVQFRETSINDFMVDPMGSIEIAPGKKAKDSMKIYGDEAEEYPMNIVESIETKFHIFNDDDWSDNYETESIKIK